MPSNRISPVKDDDAYSTDSDMWSDSDIESEVGSRNASIVSLTTDKLTSIIRDHFCNIDPVSDSGRKLQIVKVIAVPLLPMAALVVQTIMTMYEVAEAKATYEMVIEQVKEADLYNKLIISFAQERMDNVLYLTTNSTTQEALFENFIRTDRDLSRVHRVWDAFTYGGITYADKEHFHVYLWTYRADTWLRRLPNVLPIINFYHAIEASFSRTVTKISLENKHDRVWKDLMLGGYIAKAMEDVSMMKTLGQDILLHGRALAEEYQEYIEYDALWRDHIVSSKQYSEKFDTLYQERYYSNASNNERVEEIIQQIFVKNFTIYGGDVANEWSGLASFVEDTLIYISGVIKNGSLATMDDELNEADIEVIVLACVLAFVVLLLPVVSLFAYKMVAKMFEFSMELVQHGEELKEEKRQTEAILHRMLPETIAKQLKKRRAVEAEVYEAVTIFFSDVVGFTSISSMSTPMQVVAFLNQLYQFFDNVLEKYDVYKVETIGDAYMVASGVPHRNGDRHANEIASTSLDLRDGIERMQIPHMVTHKLQLRIGLHSGPCVAGVVGNKMPRYCLFGHTIQIASKMESTGVAQKIQITLACKERLDKLAGHVFITEKRDTVDFEGIGEIERYFLVGRRVTNEKKQKESTPVEVEQPNTANNDT